MNKKTIIPLVILAILVAIAPFFLGDVASTKLSLSITLLSGLSSILTLVIAFLLYNKYGIAKRVIEKQTDFALDLLEQINCITIMFEFDDHVVFYYPGTIKTINFEKYYDVHLLFEENYPQFLSGILRGRNSIYAPKEISDKIEALRPKIMVSKFDPDIKYGRILAETSQTKQYYRYTTEDVTFMSYLVNWSELIGETKKWLLKNAEENFDLNIYE